MSADADPAAADTAAIRVVLPPHLRTLAHCPREITVSAVPTQRGVIDAIERSYPVLRGTIRDARTGRRRAFVRYFGCERDLSHEPPDEPLPDPIRLGSEPLLVVGAMAGG